MVKLVKWNKRALEQLENTAQYLEDNYSKTSADQFVQQVFDRIRVLEKYPNIGRKAPNRKTVRFILVGKNLRLYYRLQGSTLIISSLFDTRQDRGKDVHR